MAFVYLVVHPLTGDHAAQEYRALLGLVVWDDGWYGGHHMPAYSVLFPPLASVLGVRPAGIVAAVSSAVLFERLVARRPDAAAARAGALWFAAGTGTMLMTGRLTFALGVAVGLAALLAAERGRGALAVVLAALTPLGSPVAAAFLALCAAAWWLAGRRGVFPVTMVVAALGTAGAVAAVFPEGGTFPFTATAFWPALGATVAALVVLPRDERVLRAGAVLTALALVSSFVLSTPMGGNAVRLPALAAGPVCALALWSRKPRLLLLVAIPLLWYQWAATVDDLRQAGSDPSTHESYYAGVRAELRKQGAGVVPGRVEVAFTDNHWDARWIGGDVPMARGWERQLDRAHNALFYDRRPLTPARYRVWLAGEAVRWVALPDAPIDYSSAAEAQLVRDGLPYLREVWHDAHWRLFAVRDPAPLASGSAAPRATALRPEEVDLVAARPGIADLRVRWTPYWQIARGHGCVEPTADDRVRLRLREAGPVTLRIAFALGRVRATSPRCTR